MREVEIKINNLSKEIKKVSRVRNKQFSGMGEVEVNLQAFISWVLDGSSSQPVPPTG
jgi:hypothetical protein